jgi:transposase
MTQFPTPGHLASWARLGPGNAESAGKRFSGRTRKGDRYVRRILVQSAWAAARCRDCFLAALFFRTAQRRGVKKAAVAVAHRILIISWYILAEQSVEYHERGGDHFDRRNPERTARNLSRRLEAIGYRVTLVAPPKPIAPPPKPPRPKVTPVECAKCARWRMPRCICLVKRKRTPTPPLK